MGRYFEKISFCQFKKDVSNDKKLYDSISLPKRSTKNSAGYDICSIENVIIEPNQSKIIKTGLKVYMEPDEVLYIYSRSSQGYKYDVRLSNCVGVIDSDYYNNIDNEGHFFIKLRNEGTKPYIISIGDKIAQGVFTKFLKVDNDIANEQRISGIGSTSK